MTMREILFRGKCTREDRWVFGVTVPGFRDELITSAEWFDDDDDYGLEVDRCSVCPETIGQYTGLTDKNGTKIFEGDIVKLRLLAAKMEWKGVCEYRSGAFGLAWHYAGERYCTFAGTCNAEYEVLGNIHDNPELMEGE